MKNGVIPNTLEQLEIVFKELRSLGPIAVVTLERDWRTRRAVERDLQITLTLLAYVCQQLLSRLGHAPATAGETPITRCIHEGILSDNPIHRKMVQLYQSIANGFEPMDAALMAEIVNRHLGDLEAIKAEILDYRPT